MNLIFNVYFVGDDEKLESLQAELTEVLENNGFKLFYTESDSKREKLNFFPEEAIKPITPSWDIVG